MEILKVKKNNADENLLKKVLQGDIIGFIIEDFWDKNTIKIIEKTFDSYPYKKFSPKDGYKALPRPFGGMLGKEKLIENYDKEIDYLLANCKDINNLLINNFKAYFNYKVLLADTSQKYSYSKNWFSIRELQPSKGSFDVHCGNYFSDWNNYFFNKQYEFLQQKHFAFLSIIKKCSNPIDIIIYKAHWDEYSDRIDNNNLKHKASNETIPINSIPCINVSLNQGDFLFFNESDYWHHVPAFNGQKDRLSWGGFVSQFIDNKQLFFWS